VRGQICRHVLVRHTIKITLIQRRRLEHNVPSVVGRSIKDPKQRLLDAPIDLIRAHTTGADTESLLESCVIL
jgi:hypothetical protein